MKASADGLAGALQYSTDLFDAATIMRLLGHMQTLLSALVANLDQRIADLPVLSVDERRQVLLEWNATALPYPHTARVHHLFGF